MILRHRLLITLPLCVFVSACIYSDPKPPPSETIAELRAHGITLSSTGKLPPSSDQPAVCSEDGRFIGIGDLLSYKFYFSPDPDNALLQGLVDLLDEENERVVYDSEDVYGWFPYTMKFSVWNGTHYVGIDSDDTNTPTRIPIRNSYSEKTDAGFSLTEFALFGDFYIVDRSSSYPVAATHVALWYSEFIGAEPRLINRVELENLIAWRRYIQPNIDISDGTVRCVID